MANAARPARQEPDEATPSSPGITHELRFVVPVTKTVPHLYPESPEFAAMPEVFATGFMVGFVEWACIQAIAPHLDEGELSLGTHVDLSHVAATPPGMEVVARVRLDEVDGRRLRVLGRGRRRASSRSAPGTTSASWSTARASRPGSAARAAEGRAARRPPPPRGWSARGP